jgi:putative membrane protein (TIGR04086 family)
MKNIRWGWILLGGFLAELAVFVVVIPLSLLAGQASLVYSAPPASFIAALVFGMWVARKAPQRPVLHGSLVGVAAVLIYLATSFGQPEPVAYIIAHALKVLGGAAGGFVALKRRHPNAVAPPAAEKPIRIQASAKP